MCGYQVVLALLVEETILFTLNGLYTLVENQLTTYIKVNFLTFSSVSLVCMSLCQYHTVLIEVALGQLFKIGKCESSNIFIF